MPRRSALRPASRFGPTPGDVAARIRAERARLGLTQHEAATRLGLSRSRYRDLEAAANPQYSTLVALVDVLGMDPRALAPELFAPSGGG